jgi:hypothetical protein
MSLGDRCVDGRRVGLVALGDPPQVPGGHTGQPGSLADRQQLVGWAQGGDLVRGGAGLECGFAAGQLGLCDPPVPGRVDDRHEVRALGLRRLATRGQHESRQRNRGADIEHGVDLLRGQAEHGGGVGGVVQGEPGGAAAGLGADAEPGAPARGALGAEKTGASRRVTAGQDRGQIGLGHVPGEAQTLSAPASPATGFLAAIGVVVGRAHLITAGARTAGCGGLDGVGGQVADDGVDDLCHRTAGPTQRRDGEPHRRRFPGARSAGFPEGNLQGCARWVCGLGTTVGDPRGTRSGQRRGTGGTVMVGGRGRG